MNWKSIEQGLPPVGVPLVVAITGEWYNKNEKRVVAPVYYVKEHATQKWRFVETNNGTYNIIGPDYFKVVAWDYYPKPWGQTDESS